MNCIRHVWTSFIKCYKTTHIKEQVMQAKKAVPFNRREVKNERKAFGRTEKSVKPVAKDTNKTRRNMKTPMSKKK